MVVGEIVAVERALQGIIDTKMHINSTSYPMYAAAFELGWLDVPIHLPWSRFKRDGEVG